MIANDRFVSVFGSVPAGDDESLIAVVAHAVREGFAIVLNKPGTKRPLCTLSARDRKTADNRARDEARELGDVRWDRRRHPCGLNHALTVESLGGDPAKVRTKVSQIIRRVEREHGALPNIGVEIGKSGMLVVDVDTDAEVQGFEDDWALAMDYEPEDVNRTSNMTVRSPGKIDKGGSWVHKNGGHYWFTLPDGVQLPAGTGTYRAPSGWVAMWNGHQVLVPPSSRTEGDYQLVGQTNRAPMWLTGRLIDEAAARMERARTRTQLPDGTGDIDVWSTRTPWADLLEPDGWEGTGLPDRCGCDIWTAPGAHASPKSATAHDPGCGHPTYDDSAGHLPLHVWTDNPPDFLATSGQKTFSKLQYVAWRDHDGDIAAAVRERGFRSAPTPASVLDDWEPPKAAQTPPRAAEARRDLFTAAGSGEPGEGSQEASDDKDDPEDVDELDDEDSWAPIRLTGRDLEETEAPPTLLPRSDGAICLLYPGLVHSIHGESESGKSWILQAETVRLALAGQGVCYLDFENDWRAVLRRFRDLGATEEALARIDYRNPDRAPSPTSAAWVGMFSRPYALVVIDGVTDALGIFGKATKENDDVSLFLRKVPRALARRTGAAVVMIDHVTKDAGTRGRFAIGGQHKMNGLDGAAYTVDVLEPMGRGRVGKLVLKVGKDKPGYVRGVTRSMDIHRLSDVAIFTLDASGEGPDAKIRTELGPPADPFAGTYFDPARIADVLAEVASAGETGMSKNKVEKAAGMKAERVRELLDHLVSRGLIERFPGARNAQMFKITDAGEEWLQGEVQEPESAPEPG